jgi:hypothetical protein
VCAWALTIYGCCSSRPRLLDPSDNRPVFARMKFNYEPGISDPSGLDTIQPGDILVFSPEENSSDSSFMIGAAFGGYAHAAIAFPFGVREGSVRLLTANSDDGVVIKSVKNYVRAREFYVYAFPEGTINHARLAKFARRAALVGMASYDWSAALFALNSNLTPNTIEEIADQHTCATVVAAALHYSGLSLDWAYCSGQYVSPADIVFSPARRNQNLNPDKEVRF